MLAKGPLAIYVDAHSNNFQAYASGILVFTADDCVAFDHAVLAVGLETDKLLGDYVIVRNSRDTSWGENGNIRIKYDLSLHNTCFITGTAIQPQF
jgi:C1A family cysteine protease